MSGIGPKVALNPYALFCQFSDGAPIHNEEIDPRDNPVVDENIVRLKWIQMPDYDGVAFFVGTEKQFQETYSSPPTLGLHKLK